jgi:DNA-binding winged helix-turn-helix (wHTH) protein/tetratricopeptide (TPR) repeat protein
MFLTQVRACNLTRMGADLHFDGWTLRRSTGELLRGTERTRLQGQPLQVLEALLAHPGELVTREQLIERLWPKGVVVDFDTALNSAVRRLRTALGDHAENPRYIETIPRRGYRFIGMLDAAPLAVQRSEQPPRPSSVAAASPARTDWTRLRSWMPVGSMALAAVVVLGGWQASLPGPAVQEAGPAKVAATSLTARECYERGRFFLQRRDAGDTSRALALFEEALRSEPAHADAWAGIAGARWLDTVEGRIERAQGLSLTRDAARRALSHDPSNAEATLRLANYHRAVGQSEIAASLVRRAIERSPDHALVLAFQAGDAAAAGRFDEAVELQRRAVQHGPLALPTRHNLAVWLFLAGRFDESRTEFANIHALNPSRHGPHTSTHAMIGQALLLQGNHRAALGYAETLSAGYARAQLEALAYFSLGRDAEAAAALQRLSAMVPDHLAYLVAEVHAYRGEPDAAFTWLQRSAHLEATGCEPEECWPRAWVPVLPLLRPLHADQRWTELSALLASRS